MRKKTVYSLSEELATNLKEILITNPELAAHHVTSKVIMVI